ATTLPLMVSTLEPSTTLGEDAATGATRDVSAISPLVERDRTRAITRMPQPAPGRYLAVPDGDEVALVPLREPTTRVGRSHAADELVEALPRRQVPRVRVARVAIEVLERAPELHQRRAAVHEAELGAEEAGLRVGLKLLHHGPHGAEDHERPPQLPRPVEAHADEEDDEVALDRGAVTTGEDGHAATVTATGAARNVGLPVEQPVLVSIGSNVIV